MSQNIIHRVDNMEHEDDIKFHHVETYLYHKVLIIFYLQEMSDI